MSLHAHTGRFTGGIDFVKKINNRIFVVRQEKGKSDYSRNNMKPIENVQAADSLCSSLLKIAI